jgi:hypothetical protein
MPTDSEQIHYNLQRRIAILVEPEHEDRIDWKQVMEITGCDSRNTFNKLN